ncbi:MAG: RNA 2',3'-cyclic phosphodiesterase [Pyrinomonadaceae bacterium]
MRKNVSKMPVRRLFVAIDFPDSVRRAVTDYISVLREQHGQLRVGWQSPQKLHLTLKFLGNVEERVIGDTENTVRSVADKYPVFRGTLEGTGVFPDVRRPRILWLGVGHGKEMISNMGSEIEDKFAAIGFTSEKRAFSPHLTIARIRESDGAVNLATSHLTAGFASTTFNVTALHLYESTLSPAGSVYSPISSFRLAGG